MADTETQGTPIAALVTRFAEAKYDTTLLVDAMLETVEDAVGGGTAYVNPTHPAVLNLEMAAALAAGNIQSAIADLRVQYPALAEDWAALYTHMSDTEFLDRFAKAGTATFYFAFQIDQLRQAAVYDTKETVKKAIIPKDTRVTVDGVSFTLLYPVVLRLYPNGVLQVSYDVTEDNPLQALDKNIIPIEPRDNGWVFFPVEIPQYYIGSSMFSIGKSYNFKKSITYSDSFAAARVFFKNEATQSQWVEMAVTYTDQVFSPRTPTAVLKPMGGQLEVAIPAVYTTNGSVSGSIRVDVYTTRGDQTMDLSSYTEDKFDLQMKPIDAERDSNDYTLAATQASIRVFSKAVSTGGRAELSFEATRGRTINNSVGERSLPITDNQLDGTITDAGFDIVRHIDTLTDLVFLATRRLPTPSQPKLVSPANIGVITYNASVPAMQGHSKVRVNGSRMTVLSKALWRSDNAIVTLVSDQELQALSQLTDTEYLYRVNNDHYYYTPFYYVLDTTNGESDLRCYALDQPTARDLRFLAQNQSLQLFVNTGNYALVKTTTGYTFRIQTSSGNYYKAMPVGAIGVQLAFYPAGENRLVYLNGVIETTLDSGEYIWRFDIESNHDLDENNLLCVTNAQAEGVTDYKAWIDLSTEFHLLHYTTSVTQLFEPDATDALLGKFMLPNGAVGLAHEKLTVVLGAALSNLWRRTRPYYTDTIYRRHEVDIPDTWEEDVFEADASGATFTIVDGELVYNYLHRKGDPKLDQEGEPILKYKAGDVVYDEFGKPVADTSYSVIQQVDLMVVDGKYLFSDDLVTQQYRAEIEAVLYNWITERITAIQARTIGGSQVYFYPKTTLGSVQVLAENNIEDYIDAEQSFQLDLYVSKGVMNNAAIKESLRVASVKVLDSFIAQRRINMTVIRDQLKLLYGSTVNAFDIRGLGGARDYQILEIKSDHTKLCLAKELQRQADRSLIVIDSVDVQFKLFEA